MRRIPPLTRRRLLSTLDEDTAPEMTPSERAAFRQAVTEAEARRDMEQREHGARPLADYLAQGMTPSDALRAMVRDLLGEK